MKKLPRLIIVFVFACLFSQPAEACSCRYYIEHFCGIVNENHTIVRAVVLDSAENDRDADRLIKVLDNLNQVIPNDTVTLYGADGLNCGENLHLFSLGDTLILALDPYYYTGVYYLEGLCGLHYLRYSKGKVFDSIDPSTDTLKYNVFLDSLSDCMALRTNTQEISVAGAIKLFPNPAQNVINIQTTLPQGIDQIELMSLDGRVLLSQPGRNALQTQLETGTLENGIYYLKVLVAGEAKLEKVMLMR